MQPFFSVIIPTYSRPAELERAVKSVLSQTFSDFEIIIVNNADEEINLSFNDSRIKLFYEKRRGANFSRNTGIENSLANFICFLDDDDEYLSNHLNTFHDFILKHNKEVAFYRTFTNVETAGKIENQKIKLKEENETSLEHFYTTMMVMHCACVHRNILSEIKFDTSVPVAQDYNLWTRILIRYPLYETPVITTIYHKSENSISTPNLKTLENYYRGRECCLAWPPHNIPHCLGCLR